ncbi:hypothetical protein RU97_GL001273 [Enterococcus canis]|uniref:Uncharacterized protein n=1 Tax=Enterococcus canis TaxID=214095 RepID=A0A1L8RJ14_9ENTE|nr:hypothetical protein [Enterococcus canis]OJG19702.1 hypothetical protein RU97_GL001273 [Enterococcus canis]
MLVIHYQVAGEAVVKEYAKVGDFVGAQLREVPDLQDYYIVTEATVDGQPVALSDKTIGGLFNVLNK